MDSNDAHLMQNKEYAHPEELSDCKQVEQELQESEEKYRMLLEFAPDAFFQGDRQGNLILVNDKAIELTGFPREELLKMNISDLFPKNVLDEKPLRYDLLKTGSTLKIERETIKKSGERIQIEMSSKAMPDGTYQCFARDITERRMSDKIMRENEAHLRMLNATKDKFFSIIAHDLKSPFNSIIGFSNLLVEQVQQKDYEGIEEYAGIIQNSSLRAMDLLMNLLEWSRSQTGRIEFLPEYFEIVALINQTLEFFNDSTQQKSIQVIRKLPHNIPVLADKAMISTVLRNLISNALKFTNPGGEVVVSAEDRETELVVSISDNGVGINVIEKEKLFRIDQTYSTMGTQKEKGTGLGLILCKEFIDKHHGRIWVDSEVGKGSTFYFALPKE
jgi:PAS domain S-box-containing protein